VLISCEERVGLQGIAPSVVKLPDAISARVGVVALIRTVGRVESIVVAAGCFEALGEGVVVAVPRVCQFRERGRIGRRTR
jgi:hypothetical protein